MSSASSTDPGRGSGAARDRSPRGVALLGSTGSIGRQALDVLAGDPSFRVVAIAAGRSASALAEQARVHRPAAVALTEPAAARALDGLPTGTRVLVGEE